MHFLCATPKNSLKCVIIYKSIEKFRNQQQPKKDFVPHFIPESSIFKSWCISSHKSMFPKAYPPYYYFILIPNMFEKDIFLVWHFDHTQHKPWKIVVVLVIKKYSQPQHIYQYSMVIGSLSLSLNFVHMDSKVWINNKIESKHPVHGDCVINKIDAVKKLCTSVQKRKQQAA